MRFSNRGPLAVAFAASLAYATPLNVPAPAVERSLADIKPVSVNIDLEHSWSGEALVEGLVVDAALPPVAAVGAEVDLAVICKTCYTRGDIDASVSLQDVVPALSLSLTDVEAYLDLEVQFGLATTIAVNLFTPVAPVELPLAGLKISALIYLDLVLSVDAAIDFTGGIWIKLAEKALLETNILSGELLKTDFSGLSVKTLPIEVQIGCATVQADLRLRVQLAAEVDVDVGGLLDLGSILPLPDIGVGLELGVYANLAEYVGLLCDTPSCPVSKESYGLNVGAAVEVDVVVEDILTLDLAPTVSIGLLTLPTVTICEHGQRPTHPVSASRTIIGSVAGASSSAPSTITGSAKTSGMVGTATYAVSVPIITSSAEAGSGSGSGYGSGLVTSTVKATTTYIITSCAASVPNCPASYASEQTIVKTVDVYTTVCPATASLTAPASIQTTFTASYVTESPAVTTVTTDVTVLVPCSSVQTFTPPTGVATVPAKATSSAYATATASYSVSYSGGKISKTSVVASSTAVTESYPVSYPVSYPASSETSPAAYPTYPGDSTSTPVSYPTYPVVAKGNNATSVYYQISATSPVSGYPTSTVVTAGAEKVGSVGFAAVLAVVGAVIAML